CEQVAQHVAERWADRLPDLMAACTVTKPFAPDAQQAGLRALGAAALGLHSRLDGGAAAQAQFDTADNMTLQLSALTCLIRSGQDKDALRVFEAQWSHDRLVMDKWFAMQIAATLPDRVVPRTDRLTAHPAFDLTNPNRFRSVLGALAMNHAGFHRADGAGYTLLADWIIKLDAKNPQSAARICTPFQTWRRYDTARQGLMTKALQRIAQADGLSRDTQEMVDRMLGTPA
ncbi:MAG: aminopeptidase N C-terminal domain-containing protein, partial [Paracoccaceae bacterium]